MTSGLLKLRTWLTLEEASAYLSSEIGHDVYEGDILGLARDGQLQLSVKLPQPMKAIQDCEGAELAGHRKNIEGVCDFLLKGPGRLELEHRYRISRGLSYVELGTNEWAFVTGEDGVVYRLLPSSERPFGTKPLSVLPAGVLLGVRRKALDAVVASLALPSLDPEEQKPSQPGDATDSLDKPLGERERISLLTIIAALAREADLDISKVSKAGGIIERWTIELDARVSARAIEDHLKRIPDALGRRGKISN